MSMYHATDLITEEFEKIGVGYDVRCVGDGEVEEVKTGFPINGGQQIVIRFISTDDSNDVGVRILQLLSSIPESKTLRVLKACNYLNAKRRFLCFYMREGNVDVRYDLPFSTKDNCVGANAVEIFLRTAKILTEDYPILMKALYTEEDSDEEDNSPDKDKEE